MERLVQEEVAQGFVEPFHGALADAQRTWPLGTAIGKLNLVKAPGKEPRLVLDSTICNLNPRCQVPEHVALPSADDARRCFLPEDSRQAWEGLSLDFKAAHKCVKVRPADRGTLLFRVRGQLYFYKVCYFGGRFSAYHWQRVGATLLRISHAMLAHLPHRAWL